MRLEDMTEGQKVAYEEKKAAKATAKDVLRKYSADIKKLNAEELTITVDELSGAIDLVVGSGKSESTGPKRRPSVTTVLKAAFLEKGTIAEMDLFMLHKVGRIEMENITKRFLRCNPEERLWVSFDNDTEVYTVDGSGPIAPEGWTGYVPVDAEEL